MNIGINYTIVGKTIKDIDREINDMNTQIRQLERLKGDIGKAWQGDEATAVGNLMEDMLKDLREFIKVLTFFREWAEKINKDYRKNADEGVRYYNQR